MRRELKFVLALAAVLFLASACDESGGSSGSGSTSNSGAGGSSSAGSSSTGGSRSSGSGASGSSSSGSAGSAGILDASWTAPTTNTDGSSLTDLSFYRGYFSTGTTPCGGQSFFEVASPTRSPQINEIVTYRLTGLLAGVRYFVAVSAVDLDGVESACTSVASAVARSASSAAGMLAGFAANVGAAEAAPVATGQPVSTLTELTADLGSQVLGTIVTFTAIATGGAAPYDFKWWLWDGATWTVLRDWSRGNIFTWRPSTSNPNYAVGVWVRSASNTADQPDGYPASTAAYRTIAFAIN
jgi:hypothetical protein